MSSNDNNGTVHKKRKLMERRSWVWDYFPFVPDTKTFICSLCVTSVTIEGSSTKLLIRHLAREHDKCSESKTSLLTNGSDLGNLSSDEFSSSDDETNNGNDKDKDEVKIKFGLSLIH